MGSSTSKAATKATQSAQSMSRSTRKYPTHSPQTSNPSSSPSSRPPTLEKPIADVGPTVYPPPRASSAKNYGIERDAQDPTLNPGLHARLAQLGPVTPSPTQSNSSTVARSQSQSKSQFQSPYTPSSTNTDPKADNSSSNNNNNILQNLSPTAFQPSASSPSQSIFPQPSTNPAVSLLTARYRLTEEAEQEFASLGKSGAGGRKFLDVVLIRQILLLRERGVEDGEIERKLGLGKGVVGVLGRRGVVGVVGGD